VNHLHEPSENCGNCDYWEEEHTCGAGYCVIDGSATGEAHWCFKWQLQSKVEP
jgi:hypothetical protein